jgi:hypothetical protein
MKRALAIAGSVLLVAALTLWASGYRLPTAWTGSVGRTLDRLEGEETQDSSRASASPPAAAERTDAADSTLVSPASQGYRFRIWKPTSATVDTTEVRGHPFVRFTVAGPENDPPALTDGFTLTVALRPRAGIPLDSLAQADIAETKQVGGAVLDPVRRDSFRGRPSRFWVQKSAMGGPVTHRLIALGPTAVADVSWSTAGADPQNHEATIRSMLRSLRFEPAPASRAANASRADSVRVSLALLREPDGSPERGCDDLAWIQRRVLPDDASRTARLEAALRALLALDADSVAGHRHFLARTNETLMLDSVALRGDTAAVYLRGRISGLRGVCDHPRARIQLDETAHRFAFVDTVRFVRNGSPTDLTPDGRGEPPPNASANGTQ